MSRAFASLTLTPISLRHAQTVQHLLRIEDIGPANGDALSLRIMNGCAASFMRHNETGRRGQVQPLTQSSFQSGLVSRNRIRRRGIYA
eukprot:7909-Eustigmatos_ZCMA.PRE.1